MDPLHTLDYGVLQLKMPFNKHYMSGKELF